jgi:tetratricopeptide (TPR) repeat protein
LDPDVRVAALGAAAVFACERGDFDRAKPLLEERLELARGIGDELRVVDSLRILGTTHGELRDLGTARRLLEESVRRAHAFKDDTVAMLPTADLGYLHMSEGDYETAIQLYEEVVSLAMTHADGHAASVALENIGIAELRLGRPHEAVVRLRDALGRAYDARNPSGVINALVVLAAAAAEQARAGRSALLLGAADALRDAVGYSLQHHERSLFEEAVVSSSAVLGEQTFSRDFAEGQQLDMDAAVSYAMSETE